MVVSGAGLTKLTQKHICFLLLLYNKDLQGEAESRLVSTLCFCVALINTGLNFFLILINNPIQYLLYSPYYHPFYHIKIRKEVLNQKSWAEYYAYLLYMCHLSVIRCQQSRIWKEGKQTEIDWCVKDEGTEDGWLNCPVGHQLTENIAFRETSH